MKKIFKIFLSLMIIVSGVLFQKTVTEAETTITDVAITYDTSKVTVSTKLTGRQVCDLLQQSLNKEAGPGTHLDTSINYTYLAKKDGESYVGLQSSDEKLNTTDQYYFCFNVEEDSGWVFGDDFPACTVNGDPADDLFWRSHSPTGDLNVYKQVYVNNDEWVFSVDITVNNARVARGSSYGFVANVDGTSSSVKKVNWSIDGNNSSNTYIDEYGILYVDSEETSNYITAKATSDFDPRAYDTALVYVVNEEPYIDGLTISPETKTLRRGESFGFEVEVTGTDYHDVNWYLDGNSHPDTRVSGGYVYISSEETASTLILTAVSVRNTDYYDTATITVIPSEVITNVDIVYTDSDALRLTTYKTGYEITYALQSALKQSSGPSTHLDTSMTYTHLAKREGENFTAVIGTDEYLNETDEYWFVFNIEENGGYIFGDDLPVCTINGEPADMAAWRSHSPTGDMNAYKRVYMEGQTDHKITFDANGGSGTMSVKFVVDGGSYTLPECEFTAPSMDKMFSYWEVSGLSGKHYPAETISNITSDLTIKAHWKTRKLNAWIDEEGFLRWDPLDGASYYMYGVNGDWDGSITSSSDLCIDLYPLCKTRGLSSGTYDVQLIAVKQIDGEHDQSYSAEWHGSYTYQKPGTDQVLIEFINKGKVIARRTGNKNDEIYYSIIENPVTPIGEDGYVFSWWHLNSSCTQYLEYSARLTFEDVKDLNGGKLYARWAKGMKQISVIHVPPLGSGQTVQEYMLNAAYEDITVTENDKYITISPEGIYTKKSSGMKEYTGEFERGKQYYLKMFLVLDQYENNRFAYDSVKNEFLVEDFYLNYIKVEPVIEEGSTTRCTFYLPLPFPTVNVPSSLDMILGEYQQVTYTTTPETQAYHVEYYSSNTSVVTVDSSGMMEAKGLGSAYVWVYLADYYGEIIGEARTYVTVHEYGSDYVRIFRESRLQESIKTADELKKLFGASSFSAVIIAKDSDFADALSGSYLASRIGAPILLVNNGNYEEAYQYIHDNLSSSGTVYILGGDSAVSYSFETNLSGSYDVKRLEGSSRYMTNLEILNEAGMVPSGDIFVVTGSGYADSLSSASVGLPILMVDNTKTSLKNSQKKYLEASVTGNIYILGETASVNASLEKELKKYGKVTRIGGSSRWKTTRMVAEQFFSSPEYVVLATGNDFADGLIASPLAYALQAPLLMVASNKVSEAKNYVASNHVTKAYIIGSKDYINDEAARKILGIDETVLIFER